MIQLDAVGKRFEAADGNEVQALAGVSLTVPEGSFTALVGQSGCGKSTLLRLVAGLVPKSEGHVRLDGREVTAPHPDVGFVFQAPTLLPWADVLTNVLFPLRILGRLDAAATTRARDLLAMAGLSGFERKTPRELSGGMQQRVAICRALVHAPRILLMDEPFGALDALTREEMSLELLRLWTERPCTILFVTHSITEAVILADQVVTMSPRPGRVADIVDVALPRPRSFTQVSTEEFARCAGRIRSHIFGRPIAA
ncbi:ABC transporter ATP-binding protein [Sediminicoccus sp. BL-A-41-H5]|uniref:ABC transporter ATP-binding protein n=1 Tax=Sediminicoccus sp. BL-A-41-H5 TaxID=3421106 RepID=UPI003D670B11